MKDRFCVFKASAKCSECGGTIILEGPRQDLQCPHCRSNCDAGPGFWKSLLEDALDDYVTLRPGESSSSSLFMGDRQIQLVSGREAPSCDGCKTRLPIEDISEDQTTPYECSCGTSMFVWPAPGWLRSVLPAARQVFGAPPEGSSDSVALTTPPVALKPIWFACPRCSASLEIRVETPRILTCEYCEADLFMPDELWRSLHPVRKRVPWWIRFSPHGAARAGTGTSTSAGFTANPGFGGPKQRRRRRR